VSMFQQPRQPNYWRFKAQSWLRDVEQHRQPYGLDLASAARNNQASFPKTTILVALSQITRTLAKCFVTMVIRDAAKDLGFTLSDAELNVLADRLAFTSE